MFRTVTQNNYKKEKKMIILQLITSTTEKQQNSYRYYRIVQKSKIRRLAIFIEILKIGN